MQRQIKFRGWNKQSKIMVDDIQVYSPKDTLSLNGCFDSDMIVLPLQYTGLKDENGKEIYEGDIVKDTKFLNKVGSVIFTGSAWYIDAVEGGYLLLGDNKDNGYEVIGDIYRNPELLK